MNIFLSYASEKRDVAETVQLALAGDGHVVFWDEVGLPPGGNYHTRIRYAIEQSDGMVFLISRRSVQEGSYAQTELKFARQQWPHPAGRVLPVMVEPTELAQVTAYLKAVTILIPVGNAAAEVAAAVARRPFRMESVDVARTIGVVADALHAHQFSNVPPGRREAVAGYFEEVSGCLYGVYESLQQDEVPHGRCAELESHAELLPQTVGDFIGEDKAMELAGLLRAAHDVEGAVQRFLEGLYGLNESPEKKDKIPEIVKAAGKFKALASSIKGGLGPLP